MELPSPFGLTCEGLGCKNPHMARCLHLAIPAICMLAAVSATAQTRAKSHVALVIGNAKYEPAVGPLRNAVNDARSVAKTLRGLGFAVTEERNVSRDELLEAVSGFRSKIKDAEVAL